MAGFSQFVPYSIGVVAENAAIGSKDSGDSNGSHTTHGWGH